MQNAVHWAHLKRDEIPPTDPERTIAILPVAAIEQHGPHLPVGTDSLIAQGMVDAVVAGLPDDLDIRLLPLQAIGKSNEHLWAPGVLSLSATTAMQVWTEIGLCVARSGIRKLVMVNAHGGNTDILSIVARELRVQADMLAVCASWGAFGYPDGLYTDWEMDYGLHGGDVETSLMLHFNPELVDMNRAEVFRSSAETAKIPAIGSAKHGWIASDLNAEGVVGDASIATAQKGAATCSHQVAGFIELLRDLRDTPNFKAG